MTESARDAETIWKRNLSDSRTRRILRALVRYTGMTAFAFVASGAFVAADESLQITLPEGLYLYQPDFDKTMRPLFIVSNGKLIDPFEKILKIGLEAFNSEFVANKVFQVFVGETKLGQLRDLRLKTTHKCETKKFTSIVQGEGKYEGSALPALRDEPSINVNSKYTAPVQLLPIPVIAGSGEAGTTANTYQKTAPRRTEVVALVEQIRRGLLGTVLERAKKEIGDGYGGELLDPDGQPQSRMEWMVVTDLDRNGHNELIVEYSIKVRNTKFKSTPSFPVVVVRWDSGQLDQIVSGSRFEIPAILGFRFSGLLDVDRDGKLEIALQQDVADFESGANVVVVRRSQKGWSPIYESSLIGCRTTAQPL